MGFIPSMYREVMAVVDMKVTDPCATCGYAFMAMHGAGECKRALPVNAF